MSKLLTPFNKFAWFVLAYNVFVVLFGAFVRATGSGAGCGAHWPLCNGVIIPRPQRIETIIEFTHRITSGITLVLVIVLVIWAWRQFKPGSLVRKTSALAVFFTVTEALVGAGLVLFKLVENNESVARAISSMVHLVNTFLLLGFLTLTAWWATFPRTQPLKLHGWNGILILAGCLGILLLGASGAVTALGDTLYPSASVAEGVRSDFSTTAPYLIRMRIYHPGIAVSLGIFLMLVTLNIRRQFSARSIQTITTVLFGLYILQILLGITNVALLAPVWIQIIHLLVSDLVWITYILLTGEVLGSLTPGLDHQLVHQPVEGVSR